RRRWPTSSGTPGRPMSTSGSISTRARSESPSPTTASAWPMVVRAAAWRTWASEPADGAEDSRFRPVRRAARSSGGTYRSNCSRPSRSRRAVAGLLVLRFRLQLGGQRRDLGAALHVELGEDVGDVVLHRLFGEEDPIADLPVRQARPDEIEDAPFLFGQRRQRILAVAAIAQALQHPGG